MAEGLLPDHEAECPPALEVRGSDTPIDGRCGSPLPNRPGRFCTAWPLKGKTRCRKHGGRSLSGIAHPKFKHGRYAKSLRPIRSLARHYNTHRADPEYLHSADEIALNQARISQLIEQLESGESGAAWKNIGKQIDTLGARLDDFDAAMRDKNTARAGEVIRSLRPLAGLMRDTAAAGDRELHTWSSINEQLFIHQKLVGAEVKRRQVDERSMPADTVFDLVGSIVGAFADVVVDRELRRQFSDRVQALIGPSTGAVDTPSLEATA